MIFFSYYVNSRTTFNNEILSFLEILKEVLYLVKDDSSHSRFSKYSQNGALPGPFGSPFGYEGVLELENSIFKLRKPIIPQNEGLNKPVKMTQLNSRS